jgi:hypothetical protein
METVTWSTAGTAPTGGSGSALLAREWKQVTEKNIEQGTQEAKKKKSGGHYGSGTEQNQARPQRCRKQEKKQKNQAVAVAKISGIQSKNTMRTESQEQPDQERDEFFIGLSKIIVNPYRWCLSSLFDYWKENRFLNTLILI